MALFAKSQQKEDRAQAAPVDVSLAGATCILFPHLSEKASDQATRNQYAFRVAPSSTKGMVREEFMRRYRIAPVAIRMVQARHKKVRRGRFEGTRRGYKKAIITLPAGKSIEIAQP